MKRGVKFQSLPNPPIEMIERDQGQICGFPVEYSATHAGVADARGLLWRKRIIVGPAFMKLDERIKQAILLHESYHCRCYHLEQRIAIFALMTVPMLLVLPWMTLTVLLAVALIYGMAQWAAILMEEAADEFAVKNGFGLEMARFLKSTHIFMPKVFYPDYESRMKNIERLIKERSKP